MEAIEFIEAIRQRVIENDYKVYHDLLDNSDNANDPVWKGILSLYKSMPKEQQEIFLNFLRLIQVNSVSHILGILDGSTFLNEKREEFFLTTESGGKVINGELQDIFLEMEEN